MIKKLIFQYYNYRLKKIYSENVEKFGCVPAAIFWNSETSQFDRFEILIKLVKKFDENYKLSIADVGCGYGSFLDFLIKKKYQNIKYSGYDINPTLIKSCLKKYPNFYFSINNFPSMNCDLAIMSGTYNLCVSNNISLWEEYIIYNLKECFNFCTKGMIFNLQYSKESYIKNFIYYTNVESMQKMLKKQFNRVEISYNAKTKNDVYFSISRY